MNYFIKRLVTCLFAGSLFVSSLLQASPDAEQELFLLLEQLQSLEGRFQQTITDERGEIVQEARGELLVKRPGKLLWSTQEPYQHQVITDGQTLWIYDLDLEQVTQQAFTNNLDQAPALLLSGDIKAISEQFVIDAVETGETLKHYSLQPKAQGSVFSSIEVVFNQAALSKLLLKDNFGQLTDISFDQVKMNPVLADKRFQFTPPEHVDLIINDR
jgi:outer membrane lipoprotein carrier protein